MTPPTHIDPFAPGDSLQHPANWSPGHRGEEQVVPAVVAEDIAPPWIALPDQPVSPKVAGTPEGDAILDARWALYDRLLRTYGTAEQVAYLDEVTATWPDDMPTLVELQATGASRFFWLIELPGDVLPEDKAEQGRIALQRHEEYHELLKVYGTEEEQKTWTDAMTKGDLGMLVPGQVPTLDLLHSRRDMVSTQEPVTEPDGGDPEAELAAALQKLGRK